jgi:hypothetical protein
LPHWEGQRLRLRGLNARVLASPAPLTRRDRVQDPTGGAYRWFACPNYFGEIVEWFGWALATLVAGGLAFAVYTTANLTPCALDHHCWHRKHFPDCPPSRRALVPFII